MVIIYKPMRRIFKNNFFNNFVKYLITNWETEKMKNIFRIKKDLA